MFLKFQKSILTLSAEYHLNSKGTLKHVWFMIFFCFCLFLFLRRTGRNFSCFVLLLCFSIGDEQLRGSWRDLRNVTRCQPAQGHYTHYTSHITWYIPAECLTAAMPGLDLLTPMRMKRKKATTTVKWIVTSELKVDNLKQLLDR